MTESPNFPQFLFEWHEDAGKVFVISPNPRHNMFTKDRELTLEETKKNVIVLAEHCDTHAQFLGFVQTYLRGYRRGLDDKMKELSNVRR